MKFLKDESDFDLSVFGFNPFEETLSKIPLQRGFENPSDGFSKLYWLTDLLSESFNYIFYEQLHREAKELNLSPKELFKSEIARLKIKNYTYVDGPSYGAFGYFAIDRFMKSLTSNEPVLDVLMLYDTIVDALTFCQQSIHNTQAARKNAFRRHELDPKNEEKIFVKTCWTNWKKEPDRYRSIAAFARDMPDKTEHLSSTDVIERWVRQWNKYPDL